MRPSTCLVIWISGCLWAASVAAKVQIVGDPTDDFGTIQAAVDAAGKHAVILVSTGRYDEAVTIDGRVLTLDGGYDDNCTAKTGGNSVLVAPSNGVSVLAISNSALEIYDFDFTGGEGALPYVRLQGAGLHIDHDSDVLLDSCAVYGNVGFGRGGGIYSRGSDLVLVDTPIYSNRAEEAWTPEEDGEGGGIFVDGGRLLVSGTSPVHTNWARSCGGGIAITSSGRCTISNENSDVIGNQSGSGGGIAVFGSSFLELCDHADVAGNWASSYGGGIALYQNSTGILHGSGVSLGYNSPLLGPNQAHWGGAVSITESSKLEAYDEVRFAHNSATYGAGIYCSNSFCVLDDVRMGLIQGNNSGTNQATSGGGIYARGGGVVILSQDTEIMNGVAVFDGGGIYATDAYLTLSDVDLHDNAAENGAGCHLLNATLTGTNLLMRNNTSAFRGGGIYALQSDVSVASLRMLTNSATVSGGGLYFRRFNSGTNRLFIGEGSAFHFNRAGETGGGICISNTPAPPVILAGVDFNMNSATNGGAIACEASSLILSNCWVQFNHADHEGGGLYGWLSRIELAGSDNRPNFIWGNHAGFDGGGLCLASSTAVLARASGQYLSVALNRADNHGGGISLADSRLDLPDDVQIYTNSCGVNGGGIEAVRSTLYLGGGATIGADAGGGNRSGVAGGGLHATETTLFAQDAYITGNWASNWSGGVLMQTASRIFATNLHVVGNEAGIYDGGVGVVGTTGILVQCAIVSNRATVGSGGLGWLENGALTMTDGEISHNTTEGHGGGFWCRSPAELNQVRLSENSAGEHGGGIWCREVSDLVLTDCIVTGNTARTVAYGNGGGLYAESSRVTVRSSGDGAAVVAGNAAREGGGLYLTNSFLILTGDVRVAGNTADVMAGGLGLHSSTSWIYQASFLDNRADTVGGGIHFMTASTGFVENALIARNRLDLPASRDGAGLFAFSARVRVERCTIVSNDPSGVEVGAAAGSLISLQDCIVYHHAKINVGVDCSASFCNVQGGFTGPGNLEAIPGFYAGSFHLRPASPCIDRGSSPAAGIDVDGEPRSGVTDIGYDEFVDSDDDGLPDLVETGTGVANGDLDMGTLPDDPDTDEDGMCDGGEWMAGTDPLDDTDLLLMTQVLSPGAGWVTLHWQGGTNATQWLDVKHDAGSDAWALLKTYPPPMAKQRSLQMFVGETNIAMYRIRAGRY